MLEEQPDILFTELSNIGLITLNRPQALNALTQNMLLDLHDQLDIWANEKHIKAILIQGAGEKAFCSGGDIKQIYEARYDPDLTIKDFFWDEYRLNHCIHHYPKPYIAWLDGITMGGGVGVSIHGTHRIVTERFSFAMPEVGIGLHPDIGGSYLLSRCPGQIGTYLGLTGARIKTADVIHLSLADYYITSEKKAEVIDAIVGYKFTGDANAAYDKLIKHYCSTPEQSLLANYRQIIDECFQYDEVEKIITALQKNSDEWSQNTAKIILSKSPTSLKVTLRQLRTAKHLNFDQCLQMEYRLSNRFLLSHDLFEGVRAAIIDKDQKPQWQPANLADVSIAQVESYFAPLEHTPELAFESLGM